MFTVEDFITAKKVGSAHTGTGAASDATLKTYQYSLKKAERIAKTSLADFTERDANKVLTALHKNAPRTRNRDLTALRQVFDWAVKTKQYAGDNPFDGVRKSKVGDHLPRAIEMSEVQRILDALMDCAPERSREMYATAFTLQATSGLRIGEILNLRVKNIVREGLMVTGKGDKERYVPVREDVLNDLRVLCHSKLESHYVFASRDDSCPMHVASFTRVFKKAVIHAGLNPDVITPHVLRHSFATHALRSTGRIELVQALLGHSDPKTTMIYARLTATDVKFGYDQLWETA